MGRSRRSVTSAPELRFLHHLAEQKDPENGIDIVVIPGVWAKDCPVIDSRECSWLKLLTASTTHDTRVFIFMYDVDINTPYRSIWIAFLDLARTLLDSVRQVRPSNRVRRPLNFICHGLGGVLLKEAIVLARQHELTPFKAISGIVFLGTPHLNECDDPRWDNWRDILLLYRRNIQKQASLSQADKDRLAQVCINFTQLDLPIPILSVYESEETRMQDGHILTLFKKMGKKLVDERHARVHTTLEEMFAAGSGHHGLPVVREGTDIFRRLVVFFRNAPVKGRKTVEWAFKELTLVLGEATEEDEIYTSQGLDIHHPPPMYESEDDERRKVLLPCRMLGNSRNRAFYGREDHLTLIDEALQPTILTPDQDTPDEENASTSAQSSDKEPELRSFAICGMGGLGKTELATEYVHTHKGDFEAIFWVNAAATQKLDAGYRAISIQLGLMTEEAAFKDDPEVARDLVKQWLSNPVRILGGTPESDEGPVIRWLLIFDNADDPDILAEYWPLNGPGSVLITSRNPLAKQGAPSFALLTGLDLPPMSLEEASQWLCDLAQLEPEDDNLMQCRAIADRLGGLPMAIVQMAGVIKKNYLTLSEFLESYDEDAKEYHGTPVSGLTKGQTLASLWNIESLSPPAQALLRVLSVLDPDSIDETILITGSGDTGLDNYPKTKLGYMKARKELMDSSLITRNMELGQLKIHRLVQDVVRAKLDLTQLSQVFNAAITLVSAVFPFFSAETEYDADRMRNVQGFIPHVTVFQSLLQEKTVSKLKPSFSLCSLFNEIAWFYCFYVWDFNLRYGFELAKLAEEIINISSQGEDENAVSSLRTNCYRYQGITSIWMLESARAILNCKKWVQALVERIQKYKDEDDISTLPVAYNELAIAYLSIPDEEEATKAFDTCIDLLEAKRDPSKPRFPFSFIHKASLVAYSGEVDKGYSILAPILEERERLLGKDNLSNLEDGHVLTFMGNICRLQGKADEAFDFAQRAVSVMRVTHGEHSSFTVHASYRLAREHFSRGEFDEASTLLRRCVAFPGDVPWYRPDLGRFCWKLGRTIQAMGGDGAEAKGYLDRSQVIRKELVPDDTRPEAELVDDDWDKLIYIPYR